MDGLFWVELFALILAGAMIAHLAHRSECITGGIRPTLLFVFLQTGTLLLFASLPGVAVGLVETPDVWLDGRVQHLIVNRVVFLGVFLVVLWLIRKRETGCHGGRF
jgi:hypothetical protein